MQKKKHAQSTIGENETKVIDLKLYRDTEKNRLIMQIESCEELENTIQDLNGTERRSTSWNTPEEEGLKFYKKTSNSPDGYIQFMRNYNNDFGSSLIDSTGKYNVAMLRIAGISEGVSIALPNRLSIEDAKELVKTLEECAGRIYKQYCKPFKLESTLRARKVM